MREQAVTKIFVFPVAARKWAFMAKPPSVIAADESSKATGLYQLLQKLRAENSFSARAEVVTDYTADYMHRTWVSLEAAKEKSIKRRIHKLGSALLSRLKPSELLFKSIPKNAPGVELIFPSSVSASLVKEKVLALARKGAKEHQKYFYASSSLLPFTSLLGILPIPNLPFFWNIFRTHAHFSALRGTRRLLLLMSESAQDEGKMKGEEGGHETGRSKAIEREERIPTEKEQSIPTLKMTSSEELSAVLSFGEEEGKVEDECLATLCQNLDLDLALVKKWRDQM